MCDTAAGSGTVTTEVMSREVPAFVHQVLIVGVLGSAIVLVGPVAALLGLAGGGLAAEGGLWFDRNYEVEVTGFGANGGNLRVTRQPVKPLEFGSHGDQTPGSVGDGLAPDHIPSFAAVKAAREAEIGRKLTPAEAGRLKWGTNMVMTGTDLHRQVSRTYGGRNSAGQISGDAQNLEGAVTRDRNVHRIVLEERGYSAEQVKAVFSKFNKVDCAGEILAEVMD